MIRVVVVGIATMPAHLVALAGFGLDSLFDIFASMVVTRHLRDTAQGSEKIALRMIGMAFLELAVYLVRLGQFCFSTSRPCGIA